MGDRTDITAKARIPKSGFPKKRILTTLGKSGFPAKANFWRCLAANAAYTHSKLFCEKIKRYGREEIGRIPILGGWVFAIDFSRERGAYISMQKRELRIVGI